MDYRVDSRSGYCAATGIFHSLRPAISLPHHPLLSFPAYLSQIAPHNEALAYIDANSGNSLTYKELWRRVESIAAGLSGFGVQQGDVVLLFSPNSIHYSSFVLGVMLLGAIVTTANPLCTSAEIAVQTRNCGATFVCTVPALFQKLEFLHMPVIIITEEDRPHGIAAQLKGLRFVFLSELLNADPRKAPAVQIRQEDPAAILYSSGTTGASKGVVITHRNLIAHLLQFLSRDFRLPWSGCIFLCLLPMFHAYGFVYFGSGLLGKGSTIVVMSKFVLQDMLAFIQQYRVTHIPVVPPILHALVKSEAVEAYDLSSLVELVCGAAPLSRNMLDAFHARFPNVCVLQGYGLTESTAVGSYTEEGCKCFHSNGQLAPNLQAKIIDIVSGASLPPNKQGELLLHGPTIMQGYFGNPGATAATMDSEGWLHTGDICYFNDKGHLFVVDRLKELIKYKGLQVAPAELEATILSHPEIVDTAVVPFPDEEAGQIPMAFVVKASGSALTEADVIEFVAKQVAPFKKIRHVAFVNSIPKSASGKILRRELAIHATSKL